MNCDYLAIQVIQATPATYADERNLRMKRRYFELVKVAETPAPTGDGGASPVVDSGEDGSRLTARRRAGSYRLLEHLRLELGNSDIA